jgi:DNA-binding transcriptional MerR regulator
MTNNRKTLETIAEASNRTGVSEAKLRQYLQKARLCHQGTKLGRQQYSVKQIDWLILKWQENKYKEMNNAMIASIITMFVCEKENQLTRIAEQHQVSYHKVFKIIDEYMNSMKQFRTTEPWDVFITIKSSI